MGRPLSRRRLVRRPERSRDQRRGPGCASGAHPTAWVSPGSVTVGYGTQVAGAAAGVHHVSTGMVADVKDLVGLLRRIAVTVAGTVILAVGVVLLVAPGPGLVVIALALAVFAVEYQWARRHLAAVQERARSAALKTAASRVATACAVLFGVGAIGLGGVLVFT